MRLWPSLVAGLIAGLLLVAVEAGAVVGPVRPVVMVALTLVAGAVIGTVWAGGAGRRRFSPVPACRCGT